MLIYILNGLKYRFSGLWGRINKLFYPIPNIISTEESLLKIYNERCSLARFGDGEFNLMRGKSIGFQNSDNLLMQRLNEVISSSNEKLLVGIPDVFNNMSSYEREAKRFWYSYLGYHRKEMVKKTSSNITYANTNMTRFWSGYNDKSKVPGIVRLYKKIWDGRDVVFIEGDKTRLGIGNDLFEDVASIKRILCPAKNAWSYYSQILSCVEESNIDKNSLIIIALGPTATVLAFDLSEMGYQALDLGHIDIQYEYYLRKATSKIAIEGKYVNENTKGSIVSDEIITDDYYREIIGRVG